MKTKIKTLIEQLQAVRESCQQAIDGDWEPSNEGFEAMKEDVAPAIRYLRKLLKEAGHA